MTLISTNRPGSGPLSAEVLDRLNKKAETPKEDVTLGKSRPDDAAWIKDVMGKINGDHFDDGAKTAPPILPQKIEHGGGGGVIGINDPVKTAPTLPQKIEHGGGGGIVRINDPVKSPGAGGIGDLIKNGGLGGIKGPGGLGDLIKNGGLGSIGGSGPTTIGDAIKDAAKKGGIGGGKSIGDAIKDAAKKGGIGGGKSIGDAIKDAAKKGGIGGGKSIGDAVKDAAKKGGVGGVGKSIGDAIKDAAKKGGIGGNDTKSVEESIKNRGKNGEKPWSSAVGAEANDPKAKRR
jgi:hypothetical protein